MIYILDIGLRVALGILSLAWHHLLDIGFIGGYLVSWRMTFKRAIWGVLKKYPKAPLDWQDITGSIAIASISSFVWPLVMLYLMAHFYMDHSTPMTTAKRLGGSPPKDIQRVLDQRHIVALEKELGIMPSTELDVSRPDVIDL